jgi:carboxypeptidase PM20D1
MSVTDFKPSPRAIPTAGRRKSRALASAAGALLALLAVVLAVRALRAPLTFAAHEVLELPAVAQAEAVERFAQALRFETVSHTSDVPAYRSALEAFQAHLERSFPLVHARLKRERVGGHSLLFTWAGRNPNALGVLLMAHQDVVPAVGNATGAWRHPPFSGVVTDGFVWGRGAWDDKGRVMAQLEAVESLLRTGVQPERTVYLAFGHDEETGGYQGARAIAALLHSRGVILDYVLDEGLVVSEGIISGTHRPVALIGVAEKGSVTLRLKVSTPGGHSSMPPQQTAIGTLARAIAAIEAQPMPARLDGVAADMFMALAPEMAPPRRVLLSNLWLFGPLVKRLLETAPSTNAMLRTTTAITTVHGGLAPNVLPSTVEATINFRIKPGDSADEVLSHIRTVVAELDVTVESLPDVQAPSPVSRHDTVGYRHVGQSIVQAFGDVGVAPGLVVGGTDSRHMAVLTENIYRFSPVRARPDDLTRIHGDNERLSVSNYVEMIRFYQGLIMRSAIGTAPR